MKKTDYMLASLVSFIALIAYLLTLAPDVLAGDSGEFQFAAPLLGIVHPTGYPLYLLLAKLFTFLPFGSVAFRVNLFSALTAALAVGAFYLVARQLAGAERDARSMMAAAAAALAFAFAPTVWSQAIVAEVYALNALFVVMTIGAALRVKQREGRGAAWPLLGLVLGLALAHHRSIILLLPALAVYLFPFAGLRRAWPRALLLGVMPLALYAYTPLRYDATPYTHIRLDEQHVITTLANSPAAFAAHALGTGFGGALFWDALSAQRIFTLPARLANELTPLGLLGLVLGIVAIVRMRQWRTLALFALALGAYSLFNALYHIGDIADFYTPVIVLSALLMALGAACAGQGAARFPWARLALSLLAFAVPLILFVTNFSNMRVHDSPRAQWRQLLSSDPPREAVLISNDRDDMTPLYYLQLVEGVRPDLVGLFPLIAPDLPHVVPLTDYALASGRAVYFIKPMDGLRLKFRMQSAGTLVRVLGPQDAPPQQALTAQSSLLALTGWSQATADTALEVTLVWRAQGASRPDLKTYVHLLGQGGIKLAQSDHVPGDVFYPPSQWQAGEVLYDTHTLRLSSNLPRGDYQLVAGAYLPDGRAIDGIARIELGPLR